MGRAARFFIAIVILSLGVSSWHPALAAQIPSFYDTPATLPGTPGVLLRVEPVAQQRDETAAVVRILFTTTAPDGSIGVASGLVASPQRKPDGPMPVVVWEHGTTGIARQCAPSLSSDPLGDIPGYDSILAKGWAIVAPDYFGLGAEGAHPYLIGVPEAESSLDAVRAARQLTTVDLSDETVIWGHSQGGSAALWMGIEAPTYAPDVPIAGVAAIAPASDLIRAASALGSSPVSVLLGMYVVTAYSAVYPDVRLDDYVRPEARSIVSDVAARCLDDPANLVVLGAVSAGGQVFSKDPATEALEARVEENVPDQPTGIPTLIAQGSADALIDPAVQTSFVESLCSRGQGVDYRTYEGRDHSTIVDSDSPLIPDLIAWTISRFAGEPAGTDCEKSSK